MSYKEYIVTCEYIVTKKVVVTVKDGDDPSYPANWDDILDEKDLDCALWDVLWWEVNE